MASDTPSASWHPAFMPNSNVELLAQSSSHAEIPQPSIEQCAQSESVHEDASNHEIEDVGKRPYESAYFDHFSGEEDPEAGGWDLSLPEQAQGAGAPHIEAATQPDNVEHNPVQSKHTANQSSTTSFARTVSHEVNFYDDDDAELDLQRTDTDPFKFFPPNDRTNSFPIVPPVKNSEDEPVDHPPPSSQAHQLMQELEQEDELDYFGGQSNVPNTFDYSRPSSEGQNNESTFRQCAGGDVLDTEEASDARFEEGLPLINHSEQELPEESPVAKPESFGDAFTDEASKAGDDFFSQIQGGTNESKDEFDLAHKPLQRKDTSMFVDAAATSPAASPVFDPEVTTILEAAAPKDQARPSEAVADTSKGKATSLPDPESEGKQSEDLDSKWAAALADDQDDDFLLEDTATEFREIDPADFFGSDDEGFLEDAPEEAPQPQPPVSAPAAPTIPAPVTTLSANGRYTPTNVQDPQQPMLKPYSSLPVLPQVQQAQYPSYAPSINAPPSGLGYGAPPPSRPEMSKVKSFADKAKGGYSSPYDLPMDVVKPPKKRISMQQLPRTDSTMSMPPPAPPRSMSIYDQPTPPPPTGAGLTPPMSRNPSQQAPPGQRSTPQLKSQSSFFEELPMTSKPRPASRQGSLPSPSQQSSYGQPHATPQRPPQGHPQGPPQGLMQSQPPSASPLVPQGQPQNAVPGIASLVGAERVSPYAQLQLGVQPKPSATPSNRYSPAPMQAPAANVVPPPPSSSARYSPAPSSGRPNSAGYSAVPPPILAHQPRTSSPLAQFEVSRDRQQPKLPSPSAIDGFQAGRSGSFQYEPRLQRVPSLPPTKEVEEEVTLLQPQPPASSPMGAVGPAEARYSPQQARHTPPPMAPPPMASTLSPPKHATSNYAPVPQHQTTSAKEVNFVPPRSQTQSPGALYGNRTLARKADPIQRPSSVHSATSPRALVSPRAASSYAPTTSPKMTRARGMSQALNLVAPTDGREADPLQRWRGAPLISWVGGAIVTSFPKDVPRYAQGQALPMILRSPGEVKIKNVKDVQPLEERLAKFPGPLKGKSKKKETIAWLSAGIENLENVLPITAFQLQLSHEDKRAMERVLLWKILRVFVEHDGALEGTLAVDKAVRLVLSPEVDADSGEPTPAVATGTAVYGQSAVTGMQADLVDSSAVEQMRKHLLLGQREKAVWAAVDKRLWGHAMLISNTVSGDLYKQVAQEFIKKEVNYTGHSNESLAALYGVMSGNYEESVDELVPSHARAGLQLMSTSAAAGQTQDVLAGLDKWQETLGLILSNRSNGDVKAMTSLGNLLSGYGRAEAAHICFIFARHHAVFGGLDDPNVNFVLVGADHRRQADQFAKETEALLLSEVYEYGLSLSGGSHILQTCPHLAAYKLLHAMTLAEHGLRDKALQYCDSIIGAITAQTKRSGYYNQALEYSVEDFSKRLKQAPREETTSWIPKPRMEQVSSSMWKTFNNFVSGDETEGQGTGSPGDGGAAGPGPFSRIAGGTPTISRSPSVSTFEPYGANLSPPAVPATRAASRYAPVAGQPSNSPYDPRPSSSYNAAPRFSTERSSCEIQRSSYDLSRPSTDTYSLESQSTPSFGYQPAPAVTQQTFQYGPNLQQGSAPIPIPSQPTGNSSSYEPYGAQNAFQSYGNTPNETKIEAAANDAPTSSGYQPVSYGYEPPSSSFEPLSQPEPEAATSGGYEPLSYQPAGFEPPSYQPDPEDGDAGSEKPKKSIMYDDTDDIPVLNKAQEKSKAEKDRENEEMFRKVAEEEAKRAEAEKSQKKGWLGGWFGGGSKKKETADAPAPNKPVRAKLGEANSFYYDPDQKRWINKKPGADNAPAKTATPPPPRAASRNGTPPPGAGGASAPPGASGGLGAPPPVGPPPVGPPLARSVSNLSNSMSSDSLAAPPLMSRTASNMSAASGDGPPTAPPSRPATSLSNASSIDDLLGATGPRKPGGKKPRKSGRYVDVMAK